MMAALPRARPDVLTRSQGAQTLLYDPQTNTLHELNETAEFIWKICDGRHSLAEMERTLRDAFDVPEGVDVGTDIQRTLAALEKKGLLERPEPEITAGP